jgi:uncharacterized membrane protein (UPF0127 family)
MRGLLLLAALLAGCGSRPATFEDLRTRPVRLPGGQHILAEVLTRPDEMARGMMFRDSLAPDRGLLFIHAQPGRYTYWMYQCRIPLDILWMDGERRIVEISPDTPPCRGPQHECPHYGGNADSQYVLELAGGMAQKYGLRVGDTLEF